MPAPSMLTGRWPPTNRCRAWNARSATSRPPGSRSDPCTVYSAERVRAHVFLCALACHVEWHLRRRLAPMLFEDDDPEGARAQRASPLQPARTSERARRKSATRRTAEGLPVHSLPTLMDDLATLALNTVHLPDNPENRFTVATQPTPLQRRAFELLNVDPANNVPSTRPG